MSAAGNASQRPAPTEPRVAIVIALGVEKASLESAVARLPPDVPLELIQCGPGAETARRAARDAVSAGATALVSWGLAGGLEAALAPGTVVVPARVAVGRARLDMDPDWSARLAERLRSEFDVHGGDLLAADQVLDTPRAKARAALETGCAAVDMESGAVASVAAEVGVPCVVVRVVADYVTDTLPPNIVDWVTPDGERRLGPVLGAILSPTQWRDVARLAHRHRIADRTLVRLATRLVPTAFECAATSSHEQRRPRAYER